MEKLAKINYILSADNIEFLSEQHPLFRVEASLSPYAGCNFECAYCQFGSMAKVGIKTSFLHLLDKKLAVENKKVHIGLGAACEPYNPFEKEYNLIRNSIELIMQYKFPLQIFTKSDLVLRDTDLLKQYSKEGLAAVSISCFTCDNSISSFLEPGVIDADLRFALIRELRGQGIYAGAVLAPIIPFLSDSEEQLAEFFSRAKQSGAEYILPSVLSLCHKNSRQRLISTISKKFPAAADKLENIYGNDSFPLLDYTNKINNMIKTLSDKYDIPVFLPIEHESCPVDGIRQKLLK